MPNSVAVNSGNEDAAFRLGFNTLNSTSRSSLVKDYR